MPRGMFLVVHDEIMGPQIKCFYYTKPVNLSKEFISKLYMSHAGFESSSHIEIKFENFRSVSCFTGNLDRRSQREGIFGIIFDQEEEFDNLDPFLHRNLTKVIENPSNEILETIFSKRLLNYLELTTLFHKVELEGIQEIVIITGNEEYKSTLLKVSDDDNVSILEIAELYKKIKSNQKITRYQYVKLNVDSENNIFLVLKGESDNKSIDRIIQTMKLYLEESLDYSLEILILLLLPSIVRISPFIQSISKEKESKYKTVLQSLQQSKNYQETFNKIVSDLIKGDIYIIPSF
ncbi:MAG: hypothetical protein ACFFFY_07510 [Promethearchaeota archaeon]